MNTLKVGFYDPKKDKLVEIENWQYSPDKIAYTSTLMAMMYQSGKHRMPSGIWIAFDFEDVLRIFYLHARPRVDPAMLDHIKALVVDYRNGDEK